MKKHLSIFLMFLTVVSVFAQNSIRFVDVSSLPSQGTVDIENTRDFIEIAQARKIQTVFVLSPDETDRNLLGRFAFTDQGSVHTARSYGFRTFMDYSEGWRGGFRWGPDYYIARNEGIKTNKEYQDFCRSGYLSWKDYLDGQKRGFLGSAKNLDLIFWNTLENVSLQQKIDGSWRRSVTLAFLQRNWKNPQEALKAGSSLEKDALALYEIDRRRRMAIEGMPSVEPFFSNDLVEQIIAKAESPSKSEVTGTQDSGQRPEAAGSLGKALGGIGKGTTAVASSARARPDSAVLDFSKSPYRAGADGSTMLVDRTSETDGLIYYIATIQGFSNFKNYTEHTDAARVGFKNAADKAKANKDGFLDGPEYYSAIENGFLTKAEADEAKVLGLANKADVNKYNQIIRDIDRIQKDNLKLENPIDLYFLVWLASLEKGKTFAISRLVELYAGHADESIVVQQFFRNRKLVLKSFPGGVPKGYTSIDFNADAVIRVFLATPELIRKLGEYNEEGAIFIRK